MTDLPTRLYTAAETRALDAAAIDGHGVPGYTLMTRAGEACFQALQRRWPAARSLLVLCGGGNNGGDGYVIARLARQQGWMVRAVALSDPDRLDGDAARACADFRARGGEVEGWSDERLPDGEVIVDALLGTGLAREVGGRYRQVVDAVNRSDRPVLAVDIPSGLSADTGAVLGCAIRADLTVTFIGLKRGLLTGAAPDHTGQLVFDDLSVPTDIYREIPAGCRRMDGAFLAAALGPRPPSTHKGQCGSVLVVGGNHGMAGAVRLAGLAALRGGAGLVKVATRPEHAAWLALGQAELMSTAISDATALSAEAEWADVLAVGPGLGQDDWGEALMPSAMASPSPMVLDADGLNWLARNPQAREDWVLTPHPAEAGRLLGITTAEVQADRFSAAQRIADGYAAICVLKGAGTVVADGKDLFVCSAGNPGMASAGMGDVLTGVIAAFLAQGLSPSMAARAGVCAHAAAGDIAAAAGQRGLIAGDVIDALRSVVNT